MGLAVKRVYESPSSRDGYRVLVDRLWPRGIPRESARLDEWLREVAPSDALRRSFHSGELDWGAFRRRYLSELKHHRSTLRDLVERSRKKRVTLLYGLADEKRNHAVILRQYLQMLGAG